jgi:predicted AlkP superfamily phosphohydrolase/phosphomutase
MAVNINTVYQTVLFILNKEQRGYVTPAEFNSLAAQVQDEIFQSYFPDGNQVNRQHKTIQSFLISLKTYRINLLHL